MTHLAFAPGIRTKHSHLAFALTIHAGRNALAQVKVEALLISNPELTLKRKQAPMCLFLNALNGVTDGARTHDNQNHNLGLYQLSYSHRKL